MYKTLAERCVEARKDMAIGQSEAARLLGIKQPSLQAIESGRTKKLNSHTSTAMVRVYKVELEWLVHGNGLKRQPGISSTGEQKELTVFDKERDKKIRELIDTLASLKQDVAPFLGEIDGLLARWEFALSRNRSARPDPAIPRQVSGGKGRGKRSPIYGSFAR